MKDMMEIIMPPIENAAYDCIQCSVATIGQHCKQEYRFMSLGRWGFSYHKQAEKCIGECIRPHHFRNWERNEHLFGIQFHAVKELWSDPLDGIINVLSNGEPLIVFGDLIDCPWYIAYQKYHFLHCYILSGFDIKNKCFIGIDAFITKEKVKSSFEQILNSNNSYYILQIDKEKPIHIYLEELRKDVEFINKTKMIEQILEFSADVRNHLNMKKELSGYNSDFFAVPIIDHIRILAIHRLGYADALQFISEKGLKYFQTLSEMATQCGNRWMKIRRLLLKNAIASSKELNIRIAKYIEECAKEEEQFFMKLDGVLDCLNH